MSSSLFHVDRDGALFALQEVAFESDDDLRRLPATHPPLLIGEAPAGAPAAGWFMVTRSAPGPAGKANGTAQKTSWSADHLFIDADGVPTLADIRRASGAAGWGEVVGGLLDQAASGGALWPVEQLRAAFAAGHAGSGGDALAVLRALVGAEVDADAFWSAVEANLAAGRIRMVFVVDSMPAELARMVGFMSDQWRRAEVWAVEVKQHLGASGRMVATTVVGRPPATHGASPPTTAPGVDAKEAWVGALRAKCDPDEARVLDDLARWMREQYGATFVSASQTPSFGLSVKEAGKDRSVFGITSNRKAAIYLGALAASPTYESDESRQAIVEELAAAGVALSQTNLKGDIRIPLKDLAPAEVRERLLTVLDGVIETLRLKDSRAGFGA